MEAPYGPEWPEEEKIKRREMIATEARYIFVREISVEDGNEVLETKDERKCSCKGPLVGFVHYRFILEEEVPVVYVYELQLESHVQGKGIGKFLMQLIELIANQVQSYILVSMSDEHISFSVPNSFVTCFKKKMIVYAYSLRFARNVFLGSKALFF